MSSLRDQYILLTGASGFLGGAVVRRLAISGAPAHRLFSASRKDADLLSPDTCSALLASCRARWGSDPDIIIHCAGLSGGIELNRRRPADMLHHNLAMGLNLLGALAKDGLATSRTKFILVGHMCMYPASAPQPYKEDSLFTGPLDAITGPYGAAKLALLEAIRAARHQFGLRCACAIPTSLYGPGDHLDDPERSHAVGAMIKRFCDAAANHEPAVANWGSGTPLRDLLFVDDAADGIVRAAEEVEDGSAINLSPGREASIREYAEVITRVVGFRGEISWDSARADGVPRRSLDPSLARARLHWSARTSLIDGLAQTIAWYRATTRQRGA